MRTPLDAIAEEAAELDAEELAALEAEEAASVAPALSSGRVRVASEFERGDHVELAAHYVGSLGRAVFDLGTTHLYAPDIGVWQALESSAESVRVQGYAGRPAGRKGDPLGMSSSDVAGVVKLAHARLAASGFFHGAPAGFAFSDGFVTVSAKGAELVPHDDAHRARDRFPFPFEGDDKPGRFLAMLEDVFAPDDDRAQKIAHLQEFAGACLTGIAPRFQKCVVWPGEGANGKSAVIRVISSVMPAGMVSAIAPQDFAQDYRRAMLAGKRLNVVSELPEADILTSEAFKAIVSGDTITGRHIREAPFTFSPEAGHLFAANRLPGANDTTLGFWRRFDVITFNRRFEGAHANPRIADEVLEVDRAAIVRWFVAGAVRAMAQGRYSTPPSSAAAVAAWKRNANPVAIFLDECTREAAPGELGTQAAALYVRFRAWCDANGHRPPASNKFGMRMRDLGKASEKGRDANRYPVVVVSGGPS